MKKTKESCEKRIKDLEEELKKREGWDVVSTRLTKAEKELSKLKAQSRNRGF